MSLYNLIESFSKYQEAEQDELQKKQFCKRIDFLDENKEEIEYYKEELSWYFEIQEHPLSIRQLPNSQSMAILAKSIATELYSKVVAGIVSFAKSTDNDMFVGDTVWAQAKYDAGHGDPFYYEDAMWGAGYEIVKSFTHSEINLLWLYSCTKDWMDLEDANCEDDLIDHILLTMIHQDILQLAEDGFTKDEEDFWQDNEDNIINDLEKDGETECNTTGFEGGFAKTAKYFKPKTNSIDNTDNDT